MDVLKCIQIFIFLKSNNYGLLPKRNVFCFISVTAKKRTLRSNAALDRLWRHSQLPGIVVDISDTEFYPSRTQNVENADKISFRPLSKAPPSVLWFSWNAQNYRRHQVQTVRIELQPNQSASTEGGAPTRLRPTWCSTAYPTFNKEILCWILRRYDDRFSCWQWLTEGQMDRMDRMDMSIT